MVNARLEFGVDGAASFRSAVRALSKMEASTQAKLGQAYWKEAKILAKRAQARVVQEPVKHGSSHDGLLFKEIADGVHVEGLDVDGFSGVVITTSMSEENEAIIPYGIDNVESSRGFRHPVFGRTDVTWSVQRGEFSWFRDVIAEAGPRLLTMTEETLEKAAEAVAAAVRA